MRVLGLDISKEGVACVELETAFGRFEIRETHEIPISPDTDFQATPPASIATQLLLNLPELPDRIVTALPMELSTFRNLQVATKDKKAIRAALEFELEDDLPFEKENLHYDSVILEASGPGSMIHIGATQKETFGAHLRMLQQNGVDPDVITTDAWAYRSLFTRLKVASDPVILIGLERTKTFFYIHSKNRPVLYREIPFGIKSIERKLEDSFESTPEQLRTWINDIGVSGIDEQVSNAIEEALEALVPEFKQTELATRSQMKNPIDQVYVTGEGALIPGFLNWLENATGKRVSLFKPMSLLSNGVAYSDVTEIRFAKAIALALVTLPGDKLNPINLRKGDFAKSNENANSPLELIKKPLPYLLVTALVFFATKTIEYKYYNSKLVETEDNLKRSVKSYFGGISDSAARNYLVDTGRLKSSVQKDLAKEREMAKLYSPNLNSPLELLKNLSQKVGKDIVLDLVSFDAGSEYTDKFAENKSMKTSLTFLIASPQLLARLTDILDKNFNLKKGNSEEVIQEGQKLYRVIFSGIVGAGK